jgi:hypothetical protein
MDSDDINENDEIIKVNANIKIDELKTFFLLLSLLSKVSKDITFEFSEIDRNSAEGLDYYYYYYYYYIN